LKKREPETFMLVCYYEPQKDFSSDIDLNQVNTNVNKVSAQVDKLENEMKVT